MENIFKEWPKIPRLRRDVVITEKIDGTCSCVVIKPWDALTDAFNADMPVPLTTAVTRGGNGHEPKVMALFAQSRNRLITLAADNYGFAKWVFAHADELIQLGEGYHYGEWWGSGIQRGYGRAPGDKRFSLFNVGRWGGANGQVMPSCCDLVPVIATGQMDIAIANAEEVLRKTGSLAAPGFMDPEGLVVWHSQSRQMYKILLDNDDVSKGELAARNRLKVT